jgi:hypothetical protein
MRAKCALFLRDWDTPVLIGLRGGPGRFRTCGRYQGLSAKVRQLSAFEAQRGTFTRVAPQPTSAAEQTITPRPVDTSTSRVRRHRERRREGLRLFTVTVPETVIQNAIARGLLAAEDRGKPWQVIQGCYAAQLSDAALDWLVNGGVIAHEQRNDAGAILRSISKWLERAGPLGSH